MKKKNLKNLLSTLLATILFVSAIPKIEAVEGDNGGAGDWSGVSSNESTWDIDHQGYRFCITKEDGTPVSNAVDVVYSENHNLPPESETKWYLTSRTNGSSVGYRYYWTELGFSSNSLNASDTPPAAILWGSGPEGNGSAVHSWLTVEANFKSVINAKNGGNYIFTFKSSEDQNLLNSGKLVFDVAKSQNYYLTVEPITWMKPSNYDSAQKKATKVYPYYVYGTINDICKWYYINKAAVNSQLGGAGTGGFYSNVLHCLWTSMYIESDAVGLNGTDAAAVLGYNSSPLADMYSAMQSLGAGLHVYKIRDIAGGSTVTAVLWYGTKDAGGNCTWTKQTEVIDSDKAKAYTDMTSSYYNGKVYFHYPIVKYVSGGWGVADEKGTRQEGVYSSVVPALASNGPEYSLEHDCGTTYFYAVKSADDVDITLGAHKDIKAMHFVFISEEAVEGTDDEVGYSTLYYPKNMNVITSATVYNDTEKHFAQSSGGEMPNTGPDTATDTRISVTYRGNQGGSNWTKSVTNVVVQSNTMQLTWIQWKTPADLDTMTIEVTPSGGKMKLNGNNYTKIYYTVYLFDPLTEKTPPDPKAEDEKKSFNDILPSGTTTPSQSWTVQKIERIRIQTGWTDPVTKPIIVNGVKVGEEIIKPKEPTYTVYYGFCNDTYSVSNVKMTSEITPTPFCPTASKIGATKNWKMKSGYGIYTNVTAEYTISVTIRYLWFDPSAKNWNVGTGGTTTSTIKSGDVVNDFAVGFQSAESKFPEFSYNTYNRILKPDSNHVFHFKPNIFSTLNDTAHYTPLWYPDGKEYRTVSSARYAYTPLGELTINNKKSDNYILIEGNVYDDWHVQAGR